MSCPNKHAGVTKLHLDNLGHGIEKKTKKSPSIMITTLFSLQLEVFHAPSFIGATQLQLHMLLLICLLNYQAYIMTYFSKTTALTVPRSRSLTLKSCAVSNQIDFQTYGHILNKPTSRKFANKYGPRWCHHHFFSKLEF